MGIYPLPNDLFHHGKMLQVVVCLEEGVACEELHENTPDTPNITRKRPAETEDDFRRTIVAGRNDRRMIFVLECSRAKVDQSNFSVEQYPPLCGLPINRRRGGRDLSVIRESLI